MLSIGALMRQACLCDVKAISYLALSSSETCLDNIPNEVISYTLGCPLKLLSLSTSSFFNK